MKIPRLGRIRPASCSTRSFHTSTTRRTTGTLNPPAICSRISYGRAKLAKTASRVFRSCLGPRIQQARLWRPSVHPMFVAMDRWATGWSDATTTIGLPAVDSPGPQRTSGSFGTGGGMFYSQDTGNPRFDMARNLAGRGRDNSDTKFLTWTNAVPQGGSLPFRP